MRLLTPEQQAQVPIGDEIGTLAEQGLSNEHNGSGYIHGNIQKFYHPSEVTDWREAVALRIVCSSRFSPWEAFVYTKAGANNRKGERTYQCEYGIACATDGVHILIRQFDNTWTTRSAQVVHFKPDEGAYAGLKVSAATFIKKDKPSQTKASILLAEYASL